jgi:hypothetical protein
MIVLALNALVTVLTGARAQRESPRRLPFPRLNALRWTR